MPKRKEKTLFQKVVYPTDIIFALVLFGVSLLYWKEDVGHYVGLALAVGGFVLWMFSRFELGKAFAIGARPTGFRRTGIYKTIRHPIYTFSVITAIGLAILYWNLYALVAVGILIFIELLRSMQEEGELTRKYGKEYVRYKKSTWW